MTVASDECWEGYDGCHKWSKCQSCSGADSSFGRMVQHFHGSRRRDRLSRIPLDGAEFSPTSDIAWAVPGRIAGGYFFVQMLFLFVSAAQIRALGVLDCVIAILPVVTGLVMLNEWILGNLRFSLFQLNVSVCLLPPA
jgi:hypothetical protein